MCNYSEQLSDVLNSNLSDAFYLSIGSNKLLDAIYIFGISPLACIGLIFNISCFILLCFSKQLKNNLLYQYLTVYTFNNIGLCFLLSLSVLSVSPRYYPWYLSVFSRIHKCILTRFLYLAIYFSNRILEILILVQRLANFNAVFSKFKSFNIIVYLFFIVCTCVAISLPFLQKVKSDEKICNDLEKFEQILQFKQTFEFNVCENYPFNDTLLGIIIKSIAVLCREFLTLCVEIVISILLIVYFRRFLANRQTIVPVTMNDCAHFNGRISVARHHELSFRKTTFYITQFSISSLILNSLNFGLLLFLTEITSQVTINLVGIFVVLTVISKPFLTIILLFKIDKHFRHFIRDKLGQYFLWV